MTLCPNSSKIELENRKIHICNTAHSPGVIQECQLKVTGLKYSKWT